MRAAFRSSPLTNRSLRTRTTTRPTTRSSASPRDGSQRKPIGASSRPSTGSRRARKWLASLTTCPRRSPRPSRSHGAARFARGCPVGPGRGSGAGSLVSYALTITDLDPIRFGLLFERFLNPERVSMPDFDIDFCQDRRDEVIAYVQERYGRDRVAQIITFGTLPARGLLRDVGPVLPMPYGQGDKLCKLVPQNPLNPVTLARAIDD